MALQVRTAPPKPQTPIERHARSRQWLRPAAARRETALEAALFEGAAQYQQQNRFLVWHMNETTKEFTGFSMGGELRRRK